MRAAAKKRSYSPDTISLGEGPGEIEYNEFDDSEEMSKSTGRRGVKGTETSEEECTPFSADVLERLVTTVFDKAREAEWERRQAEDKRETTTTSSLTKLVEALSKSHEEQLAFAIRAKGEEQRFALEHDAIMKEHWKEEKDERAARARKAAIPPPRPMEKGQDVADYIDLFLCNMESRDIPEAAQARHLLPLLNSTATTALAGLSADDKDNIGTVVEVLLSAANVAPTYVAQEFWNVEKQSGEGVRATFSQITKLTSRMGSSAEKILDRILVEKLTQMFHTDIQQYVREREPTDGKEATEIICRYFRSKGIDEQKYVKSKPGTYKSAEERQRDEPGNHKTDKWSNAYPRWKRYYKEKPYDSRQPSDTNRSHDDDLRREDSQQRGVVSNTKESKSKDTGQGSKTSSSHQSTQQPHQSWTETRKCHFCGKVGHIMKDCRRRKHVAAAHVPSLAAVAGDALVVSGTIGGEKINEMLCDSGATICVIAEHLVPKDARKEENVWIGTVDVDPRSYPTVIVPAVVQGKKFQLFAAVMPAERLPYPVILGRYFPGKTVSWSMKVSDGS